MLLQLACTMVHLDMFPIYACNPDMNLGAKRSFVECFLVRKCIIKCVPVLPGGLFKNLQRVII